MARKKSFNHSPTHDPERPEWPERPERRTVSPGCVWTSLVVTLSWNILGASKKVIPIDPLRNPDFHGIFLCVLSVGVDFFVVVSKQGNFLIPYQLVSWVHLSRSSSWYVTQKTMVTIHMASDPPNHCVGHPSKRMQGVKQCNPRTNRLSLVVFAIDSSKC